MKTGERSKNRRQLMAELDIARRRIAELEASAGETVGPGRGETEMRAIVDALPDLVIRVHRDGTFLDVKSPSQEILARPAEEIVGRNIRQTGLPERVIAIHLWSMEAALRTRTVQAFEYPLEVPKGAREFEGRAVACSEDEVLLVIRDITESKRASERLRRLEAHLHQARRMESIGRLAAGTAHNLNNLLSPILSYAELLLDWNTPAEKQRHHLQAILKAAGGARELTQQLLAVGSEQEHEVRRIDLRQVVADYEKILRGAVRNGIALELRRHSGPLEIEADPFQIQQILLNLTLNARDAIDGHGRVVIDTLGVVIDDSDPELQPGRYGALRVSDTGGGVDRSIRDRIFDPFFTTKDSDKGTGLGLASVHGIVQQHGGGIRLDSTVGEGSVFEVLFPLCEGVAEPPAAPPESVDVHDRATVVLVEDDEMVNRLISRILRDNGYTVLTAAGGDECLHLVERHPGRIDLLLTDVVMPRISGRELYQRLSSLLPELKVLYMSGQTDDVLGRHGIDRQAVRLMLKPFSIPHLLSEVRAALAEGRPAAG